MQIKKYFENVVYVSEENWGYWKIKNKDEIEKVTHVTMPIQDYKALLSNLKIISKQMEAYETELKDKEIKIIGFERIMRERSNQARGIVPKKESDGYLVLRSQQSEDVYEYAMSEEEYASQSERFKIDHAYIENEEPIIKAKVKVWKTTIQTPVNATMPAEQAEKMIYNTLMERVISEMGCDYFNEFDENGLCRGFVDEDTGEVVCRLYKWRLNANYRTNLWEVEVYTTKELEVPEYRKPVFYQVNKSNMKVKKAV